MLRSEFENLPDHRQNQANVQISIADANASMLAMFSLKKPSLLSFEEMATSPKAQQNLSTLFGVRVIPSDTQARAIIDNIPTDEYRSIFKTLFSTAQRGKILENFKFLPDNSYLVALDGTGVFTSNDVHCDGCLEKK